MSNDQGGIRSQKRKKKKKETVALEGVEGSCSESMNGSGDFSQGMGDSGLKRKGKTRKTKKSQSTAHRQYPETIITAMLEELSDDLVEEPLRKTGRYGTEDAIASPSRHSDRVFVECRNGFSATPRAKLFHPTSAIEEGIEKELNSKARSPLALAILVQRFTRPLYTFSHGLLAGLALFHIILVYGGGTKGSLFLSSYAHYARIYQTLFFLLSLVCTVSVLDRCDVSELDAQQILELFRYGRSSLLAILIYLFTITLTSTAAIWDDQIALLLYSGNFTMPEHDMQVWRDLNLSRSLAAIAGWVIVAFFPSEDMLHVHLSDMMSYSEGSAITTNPNRY